MRRERARTPQQADAPRCLEHRAAVSVAGGDGLGPSARHRCAGGSRARGFSRMGSRRIRITRSNISGLAQGGIVSRARRGLKRNAFVRRSSRSLLRIAPWQTARDDVPGCFACRLPLDRLQDGVCARRRERAPNRGVGSRSHVEPNPQAGPSCDCAALRARREASAFSVLRGRRQRRNLVVSRRRVKTQAPTIASTPTALWSSASGGSAWLPGEEPCRDKPLRSIFDVRRRPQRRTRRAPHAKSAAAEAPQPNSAAAEQRCRQSCRNNQSITSRLFPTRVHLVPFTQGVSGHGSAQNPFCAPGGPTQV